MDGARMNRVAGAPAWGTRADLGDIVAREVIPRLIGACRPRIVDHRPASAHAETLTRLSIARDSRASLGLVETLMDQGYPPEGLLEDLLGAAGARLNALWLSDALDFVDVALATARLSRCARAIGARAARRVSEKAPLVLIVTPQGERHELGPVVLAEAMRVGGWRVVERFGSAPAEAAAAAGAGQFALMAVSVGSRCETETARAMIAALRAAGPKDAGLIVGGAGVAAGDALGADAILTDARAALTWGRTDLPNLPRVANTDAPPAP